jgi:hypothetical protein
MASRPVAGTMLLIAVFGVLWLKTTFSGFAALLRGLFGA